VVHDPPSREPPMPPTPTPSCAPPNEPFAFRLDLSAHHAACLMAREEGCSVSDVLLRALRIGLHPPAREGRHGG
jgi:hypothetical protein